MGVVGFIETERWEGRAIDCSQSFVNLIRVALDPFQESISDLKEVTQPLARICLPRSKMDSSALRRQDSAAQTFFGVDENSS